MRFKRVFMAIGIFFVFLISSSFSLEPRLLWKKEIPSKAYASFAEETGDIIFIHGKNKERITFVNKDGKIIWQWGPHLNMVALPPIGISKNGEYFAFTAGEEEPPTDIGDFSYLYRKDGKKLWEDEDLGAITISPNGKYILFSSTPSWEGPTQLWDLRKKVIWRKDIGGVIEAIFSSDSNSIVFVTERGICPDVYLLSISDTKLIRIGSGYVTSVSQNGEFVGIEVECSLAYEGRNLPLPKDGIYRKTGELIMEGKNTISPNAKIVVSHFEKRVEIKEFPNGIKTGEYPIQRWQYPKIILSCGTKISSDGRYIALFGKWMGKESKSNLFVIDTYKGSIWGTLIEGIGYQDFVDLFLTSDGKYLSLVVSRNEKSIFYFYRIY